ncbi:MAG: hypothetical protein KDB88_12190 [Flavobacteriales bacterium]|nr:hypothetical protein [Flavobacteriales bacterium]
MRKTTLLLGAMIIALPGLTQTGVWPTGNAAWKVMHVQPHGLLVWATPNQLDIINGLLYTEISYTLGNDTVLNGQQYNTLLHGWDSFFESAQNAQVDTTVDYPPQPAVFRGGFRSVGDEVYFWNVTDQSEHLLYDFDLQAGDPLPNSFVHQNANASVASIDTVVIGGQPRRRYQLQGTGIAGSYLLEGIGSNHGPIEHIGIGFDISDALICFGEEGYTLFPDTGAACGPDWTTDLHELVDPHGPVATVIPNPFAAEAAVVFDPSVGQLERWVLMDALGRELDAGGAFQNGVRISGEGLSEGVYFVRWWSSRGLSGIVRVVKSA